MKKFFSIFLVTLLLMTGTFARVYAEPDEEGESETFIEDVDPDTLNIKYLGEDVYEDKDDDPVYAESDVVRVSIKLERPATLELYPAEDVAENREAMAYREQLQDEQETIAEVIDSKIASDLDVQWNLTLAANIISANVEYGDIETIKDVQGVDDVFVETRYELQDDEVNTAITTEYMTGALQAWAQGYTGAGSRVAIVDTGVNQDHISFDPVAFEYSLTKDGESLEDYDLLTVDKINSVLDQLNQNNTASKHNIDSADLVYKNSKIPFAFNYIDGNYTTDHFSDKQGEHGSHVAGITAANKYLRVDGNFVEATDVYGAIGNAPDAQIFAMKVFGAGGGAYDSDYFAAIEDAIILKADAINLSLGSGNPGSSFAGIYQSIMDNIVATNTTLIMSAGNSSYWTSSSKNPTKDLYLEDISQATGGTPGSVLNTLSVASADNVGSVGMPLKYEDRSMYYTIGSRESGRPESIYDKAGEHEFVYVDSVGDGQDLVAVSQYEDLKGKIIIVNRGGISFYQKANAGIDYSPVAMIVANNQPGTLTMSLDNYTGNFPVILITQADAEYIKKTAASHTAGDYTYYTGKITVTTAADSALNDDRSNALISTFSSWGVPGSLAIKPEIAAPGGNIWSVDGMTSEYYESMSGTSMAAPHVTGMMAVLGQYVRENDLTSETDGLTRRALMNSLLMSTATPMFVDGTYVPVLQQGAGLADVNAAINARSYILMNEGSLLSASSARDGKVKAEFGQDASRSGNYAYSFTINNMSDEDIDYSFRTDVFTQDDYEYDGLRYLDLYTRRLSSSVSYSYEVHDVDMDGDTDKDDVQALLDYITGNVSGDSLDLSAGEMDGKSGISTYDAQLLLECVERTGEEVLRVPAHDSAEVSVIIQVNDEELSQRPNGGYVEGFTYITCVSETEDGAIADVEHSIPFLGLYGSFTDAPMTDPVSALDAYYPNDKVSYFEGTSQTNYMEVRYPRQARKNVFTGNPYIGEETFPEDRLAVNEETLITRFVETFIRNVATAATVVFDENDEVIFTSKPKTNIDGAFYYANGASWEYTKPTSLPVDLSYADLGLHEDDEAYIVQFAVPEYYALMLDPNAKDGSISAEEIVDLYEEGQLGKGSYLGYRLKVDNTTPELEIEFNEEEKKIHVSVKDNDYIAYLALMDVSGDTVFEGFVPEQNEEGETVEYTFDVSEIKENAVVIFTGDYAANEKAKLVRINDGEIIRKIRTPIYRLTDTLEAGHRYIIADTNKAGNAKVLMSMGTNALTSSASLNVVEDKEDIYILQSDVKKDAILWDSEEYGPYVGFYNADDEGGLGYNSFNGPYACWEDPSYADPFVYSGSRLLWAPYASSGYGMYFDSSYFMFGAAGDIYLYVEDELVRYETVDPENASSIELSEDEATLILGVYDELQLYATVEPNFIEDRTVTWSSSDENVVTVDENGAVKAHAVGTAEVVATSNQTPALSKAAKIAVVDSQPMNAMIFAQVAYEDDRMEFDAIDLNDMTTAAVGEAVWPFYGGGESGNYIYGNDLDNDYYRYEITDEGIVYDGTFGQFEIADNYAHYDMANAPHVSLDLGTGVDPFEFSYDAIGVSKAGYLQLLSGSKLNYFDLSDLAQFVAITFAGFNDKKEGEIDLYYYALSSEGEMYIFMISVYSENGVGDFDLNYGKIGKVNIMTMSEDLTVYSMTYAGYIAGVDGVFISDNTTKSIYFVDFSNASANGFDARYIGSIKGATNLSTLFDLAYDGADVNSYEAPERYAEIMKANVPLKAQTAESFAEPVKVDDLIIEQPAEEPAAEEEEPIVAPETETDPIEVPSEEPAEGSETGTEGPEVPELLADPEEPAEEPEEPTDPEPSETETLPEEEPVVEEPVADDPQRMIPGSLNAVKTSSAKKADFIKNEIVYPQKEIEFVSKDDETEVVYKEDIDVKNGLIVLHYDAKGTKYLGYDAETDLSSVHVDEQNGVIRFACASLNPVKAQDAIAGFTFDKGCEDTSYRIEVLEKGSDTDVHETETQTADGHGHRYYLAAWMWEDDYSGATVFFNCLNDDHHQERVRASVSKSVIEATAGRAGAITYTASAWFNGREYTDSRTIVLPATGHTYEFVGFEWSEDGTNAYALFKDTKTGEMTKIAASITEVREEPTADKEGSVTYTATIEYGGKTYTDEKTVSLPKTDKDPNETPEDKDEKDKDADQDAAPEIDPKDQDSRKKLSILDALFALAALGLGIFMALKGNFLGLIVAALSLIGFFLTQSFTGPLIFADKWAILFGILCAANVFLLIFGKRRNDDLF